MRFAQAFALARKMKIAETPVIPGRLFSLEIGVGGKLPKDYFTFMDRVGHFGLPEGELHDPSLILWYGSCNFLGRHSTQRVAGATGGDVQ